MAIAEFVRFAFNPPVSVFSPRTTLQPTLCSSVITPPTPTPTPVLAVAFTFPNEHLVLLCPCLGHFGGSLSPTHGPGCRPSLPGTQGPL